MATATLHGYVVTSKRILPSSERLRLHTSTRVSSSSGVLDIGVNGKTFSGLVVRAATVIAPKAGTQVVYSKYAGTEVEFNGCKHLLLKEDDIVGVLDTDDVRDLRPSNDRILIKVAEAEERTSGGLLLTAVVKERPSTATVVAVGPGPLDEEGKRKPLSIGPGSTVFFSKFAGSEFKSADGSDYVVLKASDVVAVLSS